MIRLLISLLVLAPVAAILGWVVRARILARAHARHTLAPERDALVSEHELREQREDLERLQARLLDRARRDAHR